MWVEILDSMKVVGVVSGFIALFMAAVVSVMCVFAIPKWYAKLGFVVLAYSLFVSIHLIATWISRL